MTAAEDGQTTASLRADKWLWQARFFKTRSLAAKVLSAGHVRLNGARISKPATAIRPGDGLSFPQGTRIRVIRVVALGVRRGPAPEAAGLYEDLEPDPPASTPRVGARPTKKARRTLDGARARGASED